MSSDGNLRTLFRDYLPDAHWTAIESSMTAGGIPDHEFCFKGGIQGWIEHKKCETDGPIAHVKTLQIGWLERRCRYGGRAFVAVRWLCEPGKRRQGRDELRIFSGMGARLLKTGGIRDADPYCRGAWEGGPSRWDWGAVRLVLTSKE